MTQTNNAANIVALDPQGDPRVSALCDDIEEYVISVTSQRKLTYITAVGALDYVRFKLMREIDDGS